MTVDNLPYPHLTCVDHNTTAVDAMLQCYKIAREENLFYSLSQQKSHPKNIITSTMALDNILYISLNYCNDVTQQQVESQVKNINWQYPNFEKIEQDVLPLILVKLLLGIMKIHVESKLLINWSGFIHKYAHAMPNK